MSSTKLSTEAVWSEALASAMKNPSVRRRRGSKQGPQKVTADLSDDKSLPPPVRCCSLLHSPKCNYTRDEVPVWQHKFNILRGYRTGYRPPGVLLTAFKIHNDTMNIWTHLLPFIIFLVWWPLWFWQNWGSDAAIFNCICVSTMFLGCCVVCGLSVQFHLLNPVSKSWYQFTWCLDISGIAIMISVGFFAQCSLLFCECLFPYYILHVGFVFAACFFGCLTFTNVWKTSRLRYINHIPFFAAAVCYAVVPLAHAYSFIVTLEDDLKASFLWFWWAEVFSVLSFAMGFVVYKSHFPEALCEPGTFDILGHSHQIWHMFVNGGLFLMLASNLCIATKLKELGPGGFCIALGLST